MADFYITSRSVQCLHSELAIQLETVAYAHRPSTHIDATDAALLIANVQRNVLDRVKLQACTIGETIIVVMVVVRAVLRVIGVFTVTQANNAIDASPIVDTVSRASGKAHVLAFVVEPVVGLAVFQVGEGADHANLAVVKLIAVFKVKTFRFVHHTLGITLSITGGYGTLTGECRTCAYSKYASQSGKTRKFFHILPLIHLKKEI